MGEQAHKIRDLLVELERRWRGLDMGMVDHLQPGLTCERIDELISAVGLRLPCEAEAWWRWHDGVPIDAIQFGRERAMTGSGLEPLPLDEAVKNAQQHQQIAREVAGKDAERLWRPTWLPFAVNGGGTVAVFDCSRPEEALTPIYAVDWHWMGPENWTHVGTGFLGPQVASLAELVGWWIRAFDHRAYRYDADTDMLVTDSERLALPVDISPLV